MSKYTVVVGVYKLHSDAENAIHELKKWGFDMKNISVVGKDYHTEEQVVGYYNTGDRMMVWGKRGAFWGALWSMLFGSALFFIPGIGPLMVFGPFVSTVVAALEGAVIVGGLSVIGAGLYGMGIPKDSVITYETALRSDKFLLIAHGTSDEIANAKSILNKTSAVYEIPPAISSYTLPEKKENPQSQAGETNEDDKISADKEYLHTVMERGGMVEGIIRIIMALEDSNHAFDRDELFKDETLLQSNARFNDLNKTEFIRIAQEQSRLHKINEDLAFNTLAKLITSPTDRKTALAVANKIASYQTPISKTKIETLSRITKVLQG